MRLCSRTGFAPGPGPAGSASAFSSTPIPACGRGALAKIGKDGPRAGRAGDSQTGHLEAGPSPPVRQDLTLCRFSSLFCRAGKQKMRGASRVPPPTKSGFVCASFFRPGEPKKTGDLCRNLAPHRMLTVSMDVQVRVHRHHGELWQQMERPAWSSEPGAAPLRKSAHGNGTPGL